MAEFGIRFDVTGEDAVEHRMLAIGDRAAHSRPILKDVADFLRAEEKKLFDRQGAGMWPPLKESTIEAKRREGYPLEILHRTLDLRESLTKRDAGGFDVITDDALHFGSSVDYGRFHKTGTRHMPKRDPLPLSRGQRRTISKMIQRHLMAEEHAAFGFGEDPGLGFPFGV